MKSTLSRRLSLFILFLLLTFCCAAQDKLYVVDGQELGYVDMLTYTYKKVVGLPTTFLDLAITPDGKFYGLGYGSIYEINPVTGDCRYVTVKQSFSGNALVSDRNGDLFVASSGILYKIEMKTGNVWPIDGLAYESGGDLCFSNGKLYLATAGNGLLEVTLSADRKRIVSKRYVGRLNVAGAVFSIGTNKYGICYLISTNGELALIDLEDATTYIISNPVKGRMGSVYGIGMVGEGENDKEIEICGNGIDDDHNGLTDNEDMACRLRRGTCSSASKEIFREDFGTGVGFGNPLPGLGSGAYQFSNTAPLKEGHYTIVNNARLAAGSTQWKQMRDQSGKPDGRMMVINGSYFPGEVYRKKIDNLCGGMQYALSASACSVISPDMSCGANTTPIPSRIRFRIEDENGNILGQLSERYIPVDPNPAGKWKEYGLIFTLPENVRTIQIVLLNDAPGGCGNDLAIDNIVLSTCMPVLPVKVNNINNKTTACVGAAVSFKADLSMVSMKDPHFLWQRYNAAAASWVDIPNSNTSNFVLKNFALTDVGRFRVLVKDNTTGACVNEAVSVVAEVGVKEPPVVTGTTAIKLCEGEPLKMKASTAVAPAEVTWTGPDGSSYAGLNALITNDVAAKHAGGYQLTAKFADGCIASLKTEVTLKEGSSFDFTLADATCAGEPVKMKASSTAKIDKYLWSTDNSTIVNNNTAAPEITWNTPGVHTVKLSASGYCVSKAPVSHDITIPARTPFDFTVSNAWVCVGSPALAKITNAGGIDNYQWNADNGTIINGNTASPQITWNTAGAHAITLKATGYCLSKEPVSHDIPVSDKSPFDFTLPVTRVCEGSPVQIRAGSAVKIDQYQWTTDNSTIINENTATPDITWKVPGKHTIVLKASGYCVSEQPVSHEIAVLESTKSGEISFERDVCQGAPLKITVNNYSAGAFLWDIAGEPDIQGTAGSVVVAWHKTGIFPVKYSIEGVCGRVDAEASQPVIVRRLPVVDLGQDTIVCRGVKLLLNPVYSGDVNTISWQDGPFLSERRLLTNEPGKYKVKVRNQWGCESRDQIQLQEKLCGCDIYLPTVFTPNGDGKNDMFKPVVYCVPKRFRFQVYNRWGQLVFSTTNAAEGWNGMVRSGSHAEIGNYAWIIEYESFEFPDVIKKTGVVTLVL